MEAIIRDQQGQVKQVVNLEPKDFKTGSKGYYGNGKVNLDGGRYQINFILVKIGSKGKNKK